MSYYVSICLTLFSWRVWTELLFTHLWHFRWTILWFSLIINHKLTVAAAVIIGWYFRCDVRNSRPSPCRVLLQSWVPQSFLILFYLREDIGVDIESRWMTGTLVVEGVLCMVRSSILVRIHYVRNSFQLWVRLFRRNIIGDVTIQGTWIFARPVLL